MGKALWGRGVSLLLVVRRRFGHGRPVAATTARTVASAVTGPASVRLASTWLRKGIRHRKRVSRQIVPLPLTLFRLSHGLKQKALHLVNAFFNPESSLSRRRRATPAELTLTDKTISKSLGFGVRLRGYLVTESDRNKLHGSPQFEH